MPNQPAFAVGLLVLAILSAWSCWAWLRFVKYPTGANRDLAGRTTAWAMGFVAIASALAILASWHT